MEKFSKNNLLLILMLIFYSCLRIYAQPEITDAGKFNFKIGKEEYINSENQIYWCTLKIGEVNEITRELKDIKFFEKDNLLFTLPIAPGSDVEITNSGMVIFYDHSKQNENKLIINFFTKQGVHFLTEEFFSADYFKLSPDGNAIAVRDKKGFNVINLITKEKYLLPSASHIAVTDKGTAVTVNEKKLKIFFNSTLSFQLEINTPFPLKLEASESGHVAALLYRDEVQLFNFNGEWINSISASGRIFRDIRIINNLIFIGSVEKNGNESRSILSKFKLNGELVDEEKSSPVLREKHYPKQLQKRERGYNPIPWMFFPFDSMRTIWNHYEQHMGLSTTSSYLHQGLDLITPIGENTFSVTSGFVKCVLTIGGQSYWRIAVSDTQVPGYSSGWLYAHLIENTIPFNAGDTVEIHDYLGDIIVWSSNWGHIHFVEIKDTGTVWLFSDNEWGINFNPALALAPYPDLTAPVFRNTFPPNKFAFCKNETSIYLNPDSLYGEIDIIANIVDYAGSSEWSQPPYKTYYSLLNIDSNKIVFERSLAHILNHSYNFYSSINYIPYAGVMYKRDQQLPPPGWMSVDRDYYIVLTNSDGDSVINLSEQDLAFNTELYPDGNYRIFVEAYDEADNYAIDSMDVKFKNKLVGIEVYINKDLTFFLSQNYPNPFNLTTKIKFTIPDFGFTSLKIYDVLGNEVAVLVNEEKQPGEYEIDFNASNLSSGVYFYQLKAGSFIQTNKMILMR